MKIKITTIGRSVVCDIEQQEIAEKVFNQLVVMLLRIEKESPNKKDSEQNEIPVQELGKNTITENLSKGQRIEVCYEDERKSYKGFLYLKCPECGAIKGFNTDKEIAGYHCFECGSDTPFLEELKPLYMNCECGKKFKYMTNMEESLFDIECINCGSPVSVKWNEKKRIYETIR